MKKEKAGLIYDGQYLVEVVFTEKDFLFLWGGNPDDYKDFLLTRRERLECWDRKKGENLLDWIEVPFDREDFTAWLSADPRRASHTDPIGQWALEVAEDPLKLSSLCIKHESYTHIPYPPPNEQLDVKVLAWVMAVQIESENQLSEFLKPLPSCFLEKLLLAFYATLYATNQEPVPPFQRLSRRRALGVGLALFDRFARAEKLPRLEGSTKRLFLQGQFNELPTYLTLSGRSRFNFQPDWRYPRRVVLCLPFLLAGSKVDVSLTAISIYGDPSLSREQGKLWKEHLANFGMDFCNGFFTAANRAGEVAAEIEGKF